MRTATGSAPGGQVSAPATILRPRIFPKSGQSRDFAAIPRSTVQHLRAPLSRPEEAAGRRSPQPLARKAWARVLRRAHPRTHRGGPAASTNLCRGLCNALRGLAGVPRSILYDTGARVNPGTRQTPASSGAHASVVALAASRPPLRT